MTMLIAVLNRVDKLDSILRTLIENGITGGTIFESTGMNHAIVDNDDDITHFGTLRSFLNPRRRQSKTMFFVGSEKDVAKIKKIILEVLGDIEEADVGFLVEFPVSSAQSLSHLPIDAK